MKRFRLQTKVGLSSPDHRLPLAVAALVHLDFLLQPCDFHVDTPGAPGHLLPLGTDLCSFGHKLLRSHAHFTGDS